MQLAKDEGLEIPPEIDHQIFNESDEDLEFLLVSHPSTKGDRIVSRLALMFGYSGTALAKGFVEEFDDVYDSAFETALRDASAELQHASDVGSGDNLGID